MKTYTKEEIIAIISKTQRYNIYWEITGFDGEGEMHFDVEWRDEIEAPWIRREELIQIIQSL
jgi:hypothetical protein